MYFISMVTIWWRMRVNWTISKVSFITVILKVFYKNFILHFYCCPMYKVSPKNSDISSSVFPLFPTIVQFLTNSVVKILLWRHFTFSLKITLEAIPLTKGPLILLDFGLSSSWLYLAILQANPYINHILFGLYITNYAN